MANKRTTKPAPEPTIADLAASLAAVKNEVSGLYAMMHNAPERTPADTILLAIAEQISGATEAGARIAYIGPMQGDADKTANISITRGGGS